MKVARLAPALFLGVVAASTSFAQYDFDSGVVPAGAINDFSNDTAGVTFFSLEIPGGTSPGILTLELLLHDLTHSSPMDLDIYLVDPFGSSLEIMTDRGDMNAVIDLDLHFADTGTAFPPPSKSENLAGLSQPIVPEGGLLSSTFSLVDADRWLLLVIDDAEGDFGDLGGWQLRGTVVPEPVTLSLLAIGALTMLRRRR